MGKTRKIIGTRQMNDYLSNDVTYYGLHKWYNSLFEKVGWMIIASSRGYTEKIKNYKMSLECLRAQLEKKHKKMMDKDKKEDVRIMLINVELLMAHVNKDF
jgi:hypothetical protein